ncbi:hypothetical protein B0H15DRAFT_950983 [Mycena belliarum]|uniref:Uncharacterized protein n=1 Tax=Mycena belliarum TaxID=1033014 RepID=A0AAD6U4B9_9AGAR|nr:hypothetical protein B0H15DRAFT_950983 [Mycena belliae]
MQRISRATASLLGTAGPALPLRFDSGDVRAGKNGATRAVAGRASRTLSVRISEKRPGSLSSAASSARPNAGASLCSGEEEQPVVRGARLVVIAGGAMSSTYAWQRRSCKAAHSESRVRVRVRCRAMLRVGDNAGAREGARRAGSACAAGSGFDPGRRRLEMKVARHNVEDELRLRLHA